MGYLIGGLSPQQYNNCLYSSSNVKRKRVIRHWVTHFNVMNYPIIAVIINRLAYFVLNRFSAYPNNTYLFDKFKAHDFSAIQNQEDWKVTKQIFEKFKGCLELNQQEMIRINEKLTDVEKEIEASEADPGTGKDEVKEEDDAPELGNHGRDEPQLKEQADQASDTDKQPGNDQKKWLKLSEKRRERKKDAVESKRQEKEVEKKQVAKPNQGVDDDESLEIGNIYEDESPKAEKDPSDGLDPQKAKVPAKEVVDPKKIETDDILDPESLKDTEEEGALTQMKRLLGSHADFFEDEDIEEAVEGDRNEESSSPLPLSKAISDILQQPFPLAETQFLFNVENPSLYLKNREILLDFASGEKTLDPRLADYLKKMDQAYSRSLELTKKDVDALHEEFKQEFEDDLPKAMDRGEVICKAEHMEWLIGKLRSTEYVGLYVSAFDCPALGIHQHDQLATFARQILLGKDATKDETAPACFIRIDQTEGKATPPRTFAGMDAYLLKAGSYVLTQWVGAHRGFEENGSSVKGRLREVAHSYFRAWRAGSGIRITFGDQSFSGGEGSEWASFVREEYTKTLLNMTKEELQDEVLQFILKCPLRRLIVNTYETDVEGEAWHSSLFPVEILEKIFSDEARRAENQKQVKRLIELSQFENRNDIQTLAAKAGCSPRFIEPLIRLRQFYLLYSLGQLNVASIIVGLDDRLNAIDEKLICDPKKEVVAVSFDKRLFDRMEISCHSLLIKEDDSHPIAEVGSDFDVSSLNREDQATHIIVTDVRDLRFSVHANTSYRKSLVAQVEPQTLVDEMRSLSKDVSELKIVKKAATYRAGEGQNFADNMNKGFWQTKTPFDTTPYKTAKKDRKDLKDAVAAANALMQNLNTYETLVANYQLTDEQRTTFKRLLTEIHSRLTEVKRVLQGLYEEDEKIKDRLQVIQRALDVKLEEDDADPSMKAKSKSKKETFFEPDLGIDTEPGCSAIHDQASKTYKSTLYDLTVGRFRQDKDLTFFKGKVEQYEDLQQTAQHIVNRYSESRKLGALDQLVIDAISPTAPEWLRQLAPLWQFCQLTLSTDVKRFHGDYLEELRKNYRDRFLAPLRAASRWAKDNPSAAGVEHVNGLCWNMHYTFGGRDRNRVRLTEALASMKATHSQVKFPDTLAKVGTKYTVLQELYETHQLLKAWPKPEGSAAQMKWMQKASETVRGFGGVSTVDPSRQGNPKCDLLDKKIVVNAKGNHSVRTVADLAMGSPTIAEGNGLATVNPEFQGFLQHCKTKGLIHLFFNHQDYCPKGNLEFDESAHCEALHAAAENEFKDTLHVITLNHRGDFYHQRGHDMTRRIITQDGVRIEQQTDAVSVKQTLISQLLDGTCATLKNTLPSALLGDPPLREWMIKEADFIHRKEFGNAFDFVKVANRDAFIRRFHEELRKHIEIELKAALPEEWGYSIYDPSAARFQEELVAQMFDGSPHETGNCIPQELVKKYDLRRWSTTMATEIHQRLFGARPQLTVEERRIFIRLYYRSLIRKILIETKANSYNESCKERIGSGALSDAEDYAYLALIKDRLQEPDVIRFLRTMVFSPAFLMRRRSITEEGFERLLETLKFMIDQQKALQDFHAAIFPNVDIEIE